MNKNQRKAGAKKLTLKGNQKKMISRKKVWNKIKKHVCSGVKTRINIETRVTKA